MDNLGPYRKVRFTDENARKFLISIGKTLKGDDFTLNPMKGVKGEFYKDNRKEDLLSLCEELIREKLS
jgi:hypothetical protein